MTYTIREIRRENFLILFKDRANESNSKFKELTGIDPSASSGYKTNRIPISDDRAISIEKGLSCSLGWMDVDRVPESGPTPTTTVVRKTRAKNKAKPKAKPDSPPVPAFTSEPAKFSFIAEGFELTMLVRGGENEAKAMSLALEIIKLRN